MGFHDTFAVYCSFGSRSLKNNLMETSKLFSLYWHIYAVKGVMETQLLTLVSFPSLSDLSRLLWAALSGGNKHAVCSRGTEADAGARGDSWGFHCSFCCVSILSCFAKKVSLNDHRQPCATGMQQHVDALPLENPIIISITQIRKMAQLRKSNRNVLFAWQVSD